MHNIDNNRNISLMRGNSMTLYFTINEYTLAEGDTLLFSVKEDFDYKETVIEVMIKNFEDGIATINITPKMSDIPAGLYFYDLQVILADGRIDTVVGPHMFKILRSVSNKIENEESEE